MIRHRTIIVASLCLMAGSLAAQTDTFICDKGAGKGKLELIKLYGHSETDIEIYDTGALIFEKTFYYTNMLDTFCLPAAYRGNKCLQQALWGEFAEKEPDPTLRWLEDVQAHKKYTTPDSSGDFTSFFTLMPLKEFKLPGEPYTRNLGDSGKVIYFCHNINYNDKYVEMVASRWKWKRKTIGTPPGPEISDQQQDLTVYVLKNAVYLKEKDLYYWLYISEGSVTDGGVLLRYGVISSAKLNSHYVIIERVNDDFDRSMSVIVVDYKTGKLHCYNAGPRQPAYTGYRVEGNKLILFMDNGESVSRDL